MLNVKGMNHDSYMDNFLRQEAVQIEVEITNVKEASSKNSAGAIDVFFEVVGNKHTGATIRQRYYLDPPHIDQATGEKKGGSLWKFRNLVIACGLFKIRDDGNGTQKRYVDDNFNPSTLIGQTCVVDFKKSGQYLNVTNETYPPDMLDDPTDSGPDDRAELI